MPKTKQPAAVPVGIKTFRSLARSINENFNEAAGNPAGFVDASVQEGKLCIRIGSKVLSFNYKTSTSATAAIENNEWAVTHNAPAQQEASETEPI